MFKKFLAAIFAMLMIFAVGCDQNVVYDDLSDYESELPVVENTPDLSVNPLTGVAEFEDANKAKQRPVAIMVENSTISMPAQTGLSKADIIYETEVEGGITRLVAVYQDISKLDKIGNVRSARYPYVDLALGHDAIYVHCGQDPTYCAPHLKDIDDIDVNSDDTGSKRIANGLSSTHNVYVLAQDMWQRISNTFETERKTVEPWVSFTDKALTLDGGAATSVAVPFPTSTTRFTYDAGSGLYTRLIGSNVQTDYFTKETTQVKNIFVLLTSITDYPDGEHRKVALTSGDGYYITNGTVQFIKWSKGAATNGFTFTDTNGTEIEVSAGNSWVCIANKSSCNPSIQ
ncbi:MAG: DUF3048 domain-containing protein [Clostridia bacterium]|nr:DUF3048 domain-containing protein [Clostridia bacterium]